MQRVRRCGKQYLNHKMSPVYTKESPGGSGKKGFPKRAQEKQLPQKVIARVCTSGANQPSANGETGHTRGALSPHCGACDTPMGVEVL